MALPNRWAQQILRGIGAPVTPQNLRFLAGWQRAEGGGTANNANFNPLNTTQHAPGSGSINSVGVRSYRSGQQGIRATVQTLLNGHYGDIVSGLRSGRASAEQLARSRSLSTWGTGSGVLRVLGAGGPLSPAKGISSSPGLDLAKKIAGPQAAAQPDTGAFKQAVTSYLLQNSNALASGQQIDPNSILDLALARKQAEQPAQQSQQVAAGGRGTPLPLVDGNVADKAIHATATAKKYLGSWYKWGGSTPQTGFDCSGLLQYAWKQSGVNIPRTTFDQWKVGRAVGRGQLHPGDAVFFKGSDSRGGLPGHVGMYLGGGRMVVAPHTGAKVQIQNINAVPGYMGARRYA